MKKLAGVLLLGASQAAVACGLCIEDKVAAVYDHAAISRAVAMKHRVAFFVFDGALAGTEGATKKVAQAATLASGVDVGTTRVSMELSSLSIAFDPSKTSAEALERALRAKLNASGLTLELVKTVAR
jgi:hypothetical protein